LRRESGRSGGGGKTDKIAGPHPLTSVSRHLVGSPEHLLSPVGEGVRAKRLGCGEDRPHYPAALRRTDSSGCSTANSRASALTCLPHAFLSQPIVCSSTGTSGLQMPARFLIT